MLVNNEIIPEWEQVMYELCRFDTHHKLLQDPRVAALLESKLEGITEPTDNSATTNEDIFNGYWNNELWCKCIPSAYTMEALPYSMWILNENWTFNDVCNVNNAIDLMHLEDDIVCKIGRVHPKENEMEMYLHFETLIDEKLSAFRDFIYYRRDKMREEFVNNLYGAYYVRKGRNEDIKAWGLYTTMLTARHTAHARKLFTELCDEDVVYVEEREDYPNITGSSHPFSLMNHIGEACQHDYVLGRICLLFESEQDMLAAKLKYGDSFKGER